MALLKPLLRAAALSAAAPALAHVSVDPGAATAVAASSRTRRGARECQGM